MKFYIVQAAYRSNFLISCEEEAVIVSCHLFKRGAHRAYARLINDYFVSSARVYKTGSLKSKLLYSHSKCVPDDGYIKGVAEEIPDSCEEKLYSIVFAPGDKNDRYQLECEKRDCVIRFVRSCISELKECCDIYPVTEHGTSAVSVKFSYDDCRKAQQYIYEHNKDLFSGKLCAEYEAAWQFLEFAFHYRFPELKNGIEFKFVKD